MIDSNKTVTGEQPQVDHPVLLKPQKKPKPGLK
jgi:hypothetical protein